MAFVRFSLFLLATITNQCLAQAQAQAQATAAPVPAPALLSRPVNLTAILEKGGQYTTFKQLLDSTQIGAQIENQVRYSTDGITIFAPIDNAFRNLKPGTLNGLTAQQQVQLVLNHVVPKFYSLAQFETVSDPVRTQATGQKGGVFGLNVTSLGNNQLNVSSGVVETTVTNALRQQFPLAVYQVDKVLMPKFGAEDGLDLVEGPSPDEPNGLSSATEAQGPVARSQDDDDPKNGGCGVRSMGIGVVVGIGLVTMGFLS